MKPAFAAAVLTLCALAGTASATEGGGSIYPVGVENYMCCALPPPGVYGVLYGERYHADKSVDDDGHRATPDGFYVTAWALSPRLIWVSPMTVAGASFALHAIVPLVDLKVHVAPGAEQSKSGIGDIDFGPALGWHLSSSVHTLLAVDVLAPTGGYGKGDLANIGRHYWALQPVAGLSVIDPDGLNADAKAMWTFNFRNSATGYTSGQELIVDYALGWGFGHGLVAGVGGYLYQQVTADKQEGATIAANKGRALAIGPSVKFDSGKGWFVTAKYEVEGDVRNRAEGGAFWVKAVVPF